MQDPGHFSEHHALFVIIVLGELLVAVGANVAVDKLATNLLALAIAAGLACIMRWMYFAYIPKVTEHALAATPPHDRGTLAQHAERPIEIGHIFMLGDHAIEIAKDAADPNVVARARRSQLARIAKEFRRFSAKQLRVRLCSVPVDDSRMSVDRLKSTTKSQHLPSRRSSRPVGAGAHEARCVTGGSRDIPA